MERITAKTQVKKGREWETTSAIEGEFLYRDLAYALAAYYIGRAPYIKAIKRTQNYDGTQTYIVVYDNNVRSVYVVERFY